MNEFDLIEKYFKRDIDSSLIELGIGDDCSLLNIPNEKSLAVSTDTLVENIHFEKDVDPFRLGFKSLAVNLSDLAAMGAKPLGFTLALTIPTKDEQFLKGFSEGIFALANKESIPLIGGDTTKGPLSITITVLGLVNKNNALRRDQAKEGDLIYVSGPLGGASYGVELKKRKLSKYTELENIAIDTLDLPIPRVKLGQYLTENGIKCAIDISDGVISDLNHILESSHLKAELYLDAIPVNKSLEGLTVDKKFAYALAGGEDYELCFTCSKDKKHIIDHIENKFNIKMFCIGEVKSAEFDSLSENLEMHKDNKLESASVLAGIYGRIYIFSSKDVLLPKDLRGYMHF
jgi:thiamine-monophosphate kinase